MLREQVAVTLERNLVRSAPSGALATAIIAGLPPLAGQAASGTLGVAAKGTGATVGEFIHVVHGAVRAGVGIWMRDRGDSSGDARVRSWGQRWFIAGFGVAVTICVGAVYFVYAFSPSFVTHHDRNGYRQMGVMLAITALGTAIIIFGRSRLKSFGLSAVAGASSAAESCGPKKMSIWLILAVVMSSVMWMFRFAWQANDWESLGLLSGVTGLLVLGAIYCWRHGSFMVRQTFTFLFVPMVAVFTMLMVDWRMPYWDSIMFHRSVPIPISSRSLALMGVFFGCVAIYVIALTGKRRRIIHKV